MFVSTRTDELSLVESAGLLGLVAEVGRYEPSEEERCANLPAPAKPQRANFFRAGRASFT